MPFWAGMLTEKQHPHPELKQAVQQASWDLFFRDNPVCTPPDFVDDPGMNLASVLGHQPLLILIGETKALTSPIPPPRSPARGAFERVKGIRTQTHQSWSNICKAIRALQGRTHAPFGTRNVESSSKSTVRRLLRETRLSLTQLEALLRDNGVWK